MMSTVLPPPEGAGWDAMVVAAAAAVVWAVVATVVWGALFIRATVGSLLAMVKLIVHAAVSTLNGVMAIHAPLSSL